MKWNDVVSVGSWVTRSLPSVPSRPVYSPESNKDKEKTKFELMTIENIYSTQQRQEELASSSFEIINSLVKPSPHWPAAVAECRTVARLLVCGWCNNKNSNSNSNSCHCSGRRRRWLLLLVSPKIITKEKKERKKERIWQQWFSKRRRSCCCCHRAGGGGGVLFIYYSQLLAWHGMAWAKKKKKKNNKRRRRLEIYTFSWLLHCSSLPIAHGPSIAYRLETCTAPHCIATLLGRLANRPIKAPIGTDPKSPSLLSPLWWWWWWHRRSKSSVDDDRTTTAATAAITTLWALQVGPPLHGHGDKSKREKKRKKDCKNHTAGIER